MNFEKELKYQLNSNAFDSLLVYYSKTGKKIKIKNQINYYFDNEDFSIILKGQTVKVRGKDDKYKVIIKGEKLKNSRDSFSIRKEYEKYISFETFQQMMKGSNINNKLDFSLDIILSKLEYDKYNSLFNNLDKDIVISYCTKEKGTMRAKYKSKGKINIIKTIKTESILLEDTKNSKYIFIANENYFENKTINKDLILFLEHITNKYLNLKGSLLIHSSGVVLDNKGILFVGEKRAGKTTMFFEATKNFGAIPITVDKSHLFLEGNSYNAIGVPSRLRVLAGTLSKYGNEVKTKIPEKYQTATQAELWLGKSDSKVEFPIKEFENFIGNKFTSQTKITTIVFPSVKETNKTTCRKIEFEEAKEKLLESLYSPYNPEEDWWSSIGKNNIDELLKKREDIIGKMNNHINFYMVTANSDSAKAIDLLKSSLAGEN